MNEINYQFVRKAEQYVAAPRAQMISVGSYLPQERVKSIDIMTEIDTEKRYGLAYNWMSETMGIVERRMVADDVKPSHLAIEAAREALDNCQDINPNQIDSVIFCGIERDKPEPATAHIIQDALGLKADHVFDIANACYGFVDGLKLASAMIESGLIRYALVTTGEVSTKISRGIIDLLKKEVRPCVAKNMWGVLSVGDAGGAVLLGPCENGMSGFMKFNQRSESRHVNLCSYEWKPDGTVDAQMKMAQIVSRGFNINKQIFKETLDELGWDKVDWAVAHQTGRATFDQTLNLLKIEENRLVKTYPYLGNITTATLPLNFQNLFNSGRLKIGDRIGGLFAGSGLVAGQFGYVV